ncbi:unnamed protein product [Meloidogyne enterolobii]|uniref:Uncharacterized protein n=1 Tax=Meloidogyne enterolobii TaxID=390850 RepID=A0ACB1A1V8_MELEN
MLVLQDLEEPSENIMATENMVVAYWERDCLGQGNLFLTDRQLIWINPTSRKGLRLPVPSIVVHAVSASNESFPEPCLFTLIDTSKAGVEYTPEPLDDDGEEIEENEDVKTVAFRLIPADSTHIQDLFATLNKCQELNPEPEEMSDEDNYDEDDEECHENGEVDHDEEMNGDQ